MHLSEPTSFCKSKYPFLKIRMIRVLFPYGCHTVFVQYPPADPGQVFDSARSTSWYLPTHSVGHCSAVQRLFTQPTVGLCRRRSGNMADSLMSSWVPQKPASPLKLIQNHNSPVAIACGHPGLHGANCDTQFDHLVATSHRRNPDHLAGCPCVLARTTRPEATGLVRTGRQ
jgi:hypothetical protein